MLNRTLKLQYWISYCKNNGFLSFANIVFRYFVLNLFLRLRFKSCGRINFTGNFQIAGYNYITIKSLSAGPRFRMDAINSYFGCKYNPEIVIGSHLSVGSDVHIGCISTINIGDNVLIGSRVTIIDHDHGDYSGAGPHSSPDTPPSTRKLNAQKIFIGDNVHIGDGAIILKGVNIGRGSIVAAGAVVTRNVLSNNIVAGNPAKTIKTFNSQTGKWI